MRSAATARRPAFSETRCTTARGCPAQFAGHPAGATDVAGTPTSPHRREPNAFHADVAVTTAQHHAREMARRRSRAIYGSAGSAARLKCTTAPRFRGAAAPPALPSRTPSTACLAWASLVVPVVHHAACAGGTEPLVLAARVTTIRRASLLLLCSGLLLALVRIAALIPGLALHRRWPTTHIVGERTHGRPAATVMPRRRWTAAPRAAAAGCSALTACTGTLTAWASNVHRQRPPTQHALPQLGHCLTRGIRIT